jgi:cell division septation protein DedD
MSPERDDYEDEEEYEEEEEEPRSIFANPWFRAALAVLILAVVGVLALPYAQEWWAGPSKSQVTIPRPPQAPPARPQPAPTPPAAPAAPPTAVPAPAPRVAEKPAEPAKPAAPVAPAAPAPKPAPQVAEKPVEKPAEPAAKSAAAPSKGDYWVQVGAFSDTKNASRLAARLKDQKYSVQQATVTRGSGGGSSGNEIFVAGAKQKDVYDKVKDKGYHVDAVKGGAVVRPALPLKDAVALSKELADAGMDVKIRRVGGGGGEKATFHLVRVGGFADRKEAEAAQKELGGKGLPGFVVKGSPR